MSSTTSARPFYWTSHCPGARIRIAEIVSDGPRKDRYAVEANAIVFKRALQFSEAPIVESPVLLLPQALRQLIRAHETQGALRHRVTQGL